MTEMPSSAALKPSKIRCDACPVLCYISEGRSGACDRYANVAGALVRVDPLTIIENQSQPLVPFLPGGDQPAGCDGDEDQRDCSQIAEQPDGDLAPNSWNGDIIKGDRRFITAIGAGTTYPDYKPAPFIVSQEIDGVDMVTVVTEGIFSYCGVKVKIDTDSYIGEERDTVCVRGEPVGHVMTSEYGSKMLSLGGVEHLTGGSKKEGRITCEALLALCNREAVEMTIGEGQISVVIQAGEAPVINGKKERLMRVGCGSATIGMFAKQWLGHADEVVVVDDHITGVLSEHEAGKQLHIPPTGIRIKGRRSTPGRYFQVAEPGDGWGGTNLDNPLEILGDFKPDVAFEGLTLFMVSTTGEQAAFYRLDADLIPQEAAIPDPLQRSRARIAENCEPALCSVLFMGGAGGSLRAGVTENPVGLTKSVKDALTHVSCGGAEAYVWPGGGITVMVDVMDMPTESFGYVPTPALVAPIEFTLRARDYAALGGHVAHVQAADEIAHRAVVDEAARKVEPNARKHDPLDPKHYRWTTKPPAQR